MSWTTASSILTTTPVVLTNPNIHFGAIDYIVFVIMLSSSAGIGIYFGYFSKGKDTTDEYLLGSKQMKTIPIAISLMASQLSAFTIMSIPVEVYSFGISYVFIGISILAIIPILCYHVVPVFYENNLSNCYEYLEQRFNKATRRLVTATFIFNILLMLPVMMFIPSLAFNQVSGVNIHFINIVVGSICVFYTMQGGIKAVVWTDVVQGGIVFSSLVLMTILGTIKTGGLAKVLELATEGGRLSPSFMLDPRIRNTVATCFTAGSVMWIGHIGLHQTCVQRIVALPSLKQANRALVILAFGIVFIMSINCFIGVIMFAYYSGCDPVLSGVVDKADKMVPHFVQDVMGHLIGMPGVFISCVFSAALSTVSAYLNSLAGVIYFDYIKPFIKHSETKANNIMKIFVTIMGLYCIFGGLVVQHFNSLLQLVITISGVTTGATVGVFFIGIFVPRVNGKTALTAMLLSVIIMLTIIVNAQINFKTGVMKYTPMHVTTDTCAAQTIFKILQDKTTTSLPLTTTEAPRITTAFDSNRDFSIFEISFFWYKPIGALIVWLIAIPLSFLWKPDQKQQLNPKLFSPMIRKYIPHKIKEMEEMPLKGNTVLQICEANTIDVTEKDKDYIKR